MQDAAARGVVGLDDEDSHWLSERIRDHRRRGVELPPDDQDALGALNGAIAAASAHFERLARAGCNEAAVHLTDEAEPAGLGPEPHIGRAHVRKTVTEFLLVFRIVV